MRLLVLKGPPIPTYEDDLEAFHWSFWDIVLNYVGGVKVVPNDNYNTYKWGDGSLEDMVQAKKGFLSALAGAGLRNLPYTEFCRLSADRFCAAAGKPSGSLRHFLQAWSRSFWEIYVNGKGEMFTYEKVKNGVERMLVRYNEGSDGQPAN